MWDDDEPIEPLFGWWMETTTLGCRARQWRWVPISEDKMRRAQFGWTWVTVGPIECRNPQHAFHASDGRGPYPGCSECLPRQAPQIPPSTRKR